jgi:hypothetical protein
MSEPTADERRQENRATLAQVGNYLHGVDRSTLDRHDPDIHRAILAIAGIYTVVRNLADALEEA